MAFKKSWWNVDTATNEYSSYNYQKWVNPKVRVLHLIYALAQWRHKKFPGQTDRYKTWLNGRQTSTHGNPKAELKFWPIDITARFRVLSSYIASIRNTVFTSRYERTESVRVTVTSMCSKSSIRLLVNFTKGHALLWSPFQGDIIRETSQWHSTWIHVFSTCFHVLCPLGSLYIYVRIHFSLTNVVCEAKLWRPRLLPNCW